MVPTITNLWAERRDEQNEQRAQRREAERERLAQQREVERERLTQQREVEGQRLAQEREVDRQRREVRDAHLERLRPLRLAESKNLLQPSSAVVPVGD